MYTYIINDDHGDKTKYNLNRFKIKINLKIGQRLNKSVQILKCTNEGSIKRTKYSVRINKFFNRR